MSNFVTLNTALSALRAAQIGIDTTSHNIANANTVGYTRQRVNFTASDPYTGKVGPMGTGVEVTDIARLRDQFLDVRMQVSNASLGERQVVADLVSRAEALLGEPDAGISSELNELWASFDELSLHPADGAVRRTVMTALDGLAARIRSITAGFDQLSTDVELQLSDTVATANDQLRQLADLNATIASVASEGVPNDLLDRRDLLVDGLSRSLGVSARYEANGTVRITLSGSDLVSGSRANALALQPDNSLVHPSGGTVAAGGEVKGYQDVLGTVLPDILDDLDAFTAELADQLNTQHQAGWSPEPQPAGTAGGPLFSVTAGNEARTIALAITDEDELATAGSSPPDLYDSRNAVALAALRSPDSGPVLDQVLRGFVTDLGATVASAKRQVNAEQGLNAAAATARRDAHAVSLDEEMVALMTYQRTYQAAARVATTVDQTLDTLVNRLGIVGR